MALLNLTAAARAAGCNRSTIARALKSGRLSATTNERGERCIDTSELMRVFGALQGDAQANAQATAYPVNRLAAGHERQDAQAESALVEVLREQLQDARERERQLMDEKARLLTMLEVEQQARREMEVKLLAGPKGRKKKRD